jgi:hypothetical protein
LPWKVRPHSGCGRTRCDSAMTKSVVHRFEKARRFGSAVLKAKGSARVKVGLVAAILFALVCAVETKAIFTLESSQGPFEFSASHDRNMYR